MNWTKKERKILQLIKNNLKSPSHGLDHLINVAKYALILGKKYRANRGIIIAAALLHDLGRNNPKLHGKKSSSLSAVKAKPILIKAGYSNKEIGLILQIIKEHDLPFFTSKLPESRILKDADFLDGFGFRGILRSVYFTSEAGQPMSKAEERLTVKMPQRFAGLEFPESKNIARQQYYLSKILFSGQNKSAVHTFKEKLIVFEGISGTGKETQAKLLAEFLQKKGEKPEIVYHPTPEMKNILKLWRQNNNEIFSEVFFFLADRFAMVKNKILPALKSGKTVISLRNPISSLVYQAENQFHLDLINYLYSTFDPLPDIVFWFDIKPEVAYQRIESRTKKTGEEKGKFEKLNLLKANSQKYIKILKEFKNVIRIDAEKSIDEIHQNIVDSLVTVWQKKGI